VAIDTVEDLQAVGLGERQYQGQILPRQDVAVQPQRAMTVVSLAEMFDQRAQVVERNVVRLAGAQIEQMEMLPNRQQELAGARLVRGMLKGAHETSHAARDGRPGVMAEAANLQAWRVALRQAGEITAQAVGQREGSGMVADDQFAPGVE